MAVKLITTIQRFVGLAADTKPIVSPVGSTFMESDTGDKYITYDGVNWVPQEKVSQYRKLSAYHWLGTPASAVGVIPATAGLTVAAGGSRFMRAYAQNRSGGTVSICVAGFFPDTAWEAGQWVNATTTYTADTTDAQDADTNDFAIHNTTINDGHIIGCDYPFGLVSYDVTTDSNGAAMDGAIEYWNGAWTAIPAVGMSVDIPRGAGDYWETGETIIMFDPPVDWIVAGSGTGVSATRYNLRYRTTTAADTTGALARRIYVGVPITTWQGVATNTEASARDYSPHGLPIPTGVVRLGVAANIQTGVVATAVSTNIELIY